MKLSEYSKGEFIRRSRWLNEELEASAIIDALENERPLSYWRHLLATIRLNAFRRGHTEAIHDLVKLQKQG